MSLRMTCECQPNWPRLSTSLSTRYHCVYASNPHIRTHCVHTHAVYMYVLLGHQVKCWHSCTLDKSQLPLAPHTPPELSLEHRIIARRLIMYTFMAFHYWHVQRVHRVWMALWRYFTTNMMITCPQILLNSNYTPLPLCIKYDSFIPTAAYYHHRCQECVSYVRLHMKTHVNM